MCISEIENEKEYQHMFNIYKKMVRKIVKKVKIP